MRRFTICSERQQGRRVGALEKKAIEINGATDLPEFIAAFNQRVLRGHTDEPQSIAAVQQQQQLQQNLTELCEELKGNHGRGGVIARLGVDIPTEQVAVLAGCSPRTVHVHAKTQRKILHVTSGSSSGHP